MTSIRYLLLALCAALVGCGGGGDGGSGPSRRRRVTGPAWPNFGRDVQHAAQGGVATQALSRIVWQTPVDLVPPYLANNVAAHPLRLAGDHARATRCWCRSSWSATAASASRRAPARDGALMWSAPTDYVLPAHDWTPSYNIALTPGNRVYFPGAGGKLFFRDNVDAADGTVQSVVFYGARRTTPRAQHTTPT